ncbi:F-box only protein 16 [Amia ocellicauda]|uniref:F-box only protein 16 n=1 Tax=Amia ocellicauda TaxID=2972642 RepID=UPI003464E035
MAFAPTKMMNGLKMQTKMSTWTPLNHQQTNDKVFEERRDLLGKWFDKWTDSQRKQVLQDFFQRCSKAQLRFAGQVVHSRVPEEALDFTTQLPRVLALYVFSFLDPRSLCRCAQVSWHWKHLTEVDQLWMPKCLRLGWYINFTPTPFEQGVWKRHYIETVKELHVSRPKTPQKEQFVVPEVRPIGSEDPALTGSRSRLVQSANLSLKGKSAGVRGAGQPPWRGSDKHPTDTLRFNYLENFDPIEQARLAQSKGKGTATNLSKPENTKKKPLSDSAYKLRKAKSLMFLSPDSSSAQQAHGRPNWATHQSEEYPITKATAKTMAQKTDWNAGMYPRPVRPPVPKMSEKGLRASQRTQRSSPSVALFEGQPWKIPAEHESED